MKFFEITLLLLSLAAFNFCRQQSDFNNLVGCWGIALNDEMGNQEFVAVFYYENGELACQFHSYMDGMKFGGEQAEDIEFDGKNLSMLVNSAADVKYAGTVDFNNGLINGKLIYQNGSSSEFNLERYSSEKIRSSFPGLLDIPRLEYSYNVPALIDDGWLNASLTDAGIDQKKINVMMNQLLDGSFGKINSMLIVRGGKLALEEYFDGFSPNDLHELRSTTKSITSLLIGSAKDMNLIEGVDQKILDFFPKYRNGLEEEWQNISLKNILTMTVGLSWNDQFHDNIWNLSSDIIQTTFEQKFGSKPGEKFDYRSPQVNLLAKVIIESSGGPVQKFAEENLFNPLGVKKYLWKNFKENNYPLMDGSLCLRPRDMAKIGQMILDNGVYHSKQVISKEWIEESTSYKIAADEYTNYGYLWWTAESQSRPGLNVIFSNGLGGQHIVIIPALSAVIITTASNYDKPAAFLLKLIDELIIPSIN